MHRTLAASLVLLASGTLMGCGAQQQFGGSLFYGNLVSEGQAFDIRDAAIAQLTRVARASNLEPVIQEPDRVVFRTRAPDWTAMGPEGDSELRPDFRTLNVEVLFGRGNAAQSYRYNAYLSGQEPAGFTTEARRDLGRALLAAREVFESPLHTNFIPPR